MNEKDENNIPEPDRPLVETENTVFDDDGTVISHTEQTITDPPRRKVRRMISPSRAVESSRPCRRSP